MRQNLSLLSLGLALYAAPSQAAPPSSGNFGIGIGGGTATSGLSMKYYMSDSTALQGVIGVWGYGRGYGDTLGVSLDYLFEMPEFAKSDVICLGWNLGPGLWAGAWNDSDKWDDDRWSNGNDGGGYFGVSGVVGLEFLFQPLPFDIVLEYRPSIIIAPVVGFDPVSFDGHVRFYF
jgi:hypothetical protein